MAQENKSQRNRVGPIPRVIVGTTLAAVLSSIISVSMGSAVFATPSPTGSPGQPGAPGTTCGSPDATSTPGQSVSANSPFNPNGQAGRVYAGNPGTNSLAHSNSAHAVSQYDIACFQQTQNHH